MKKCVLGVIVFLVAGALTAFASAGSESGTREVNYIINGMFFEVYPEKMEGVYEFGRIEMSDGRKMFVIKTETPLSDWSLGLAVPVEEVKDGEKALELAGEASLMYTRTSSSYPKVEVGEAFPKTALRDTSGNQVVVPSEAGRPVLLHFWFTGCNPCKKEMGEISQWIEKYPGVDFVAVTYNSTEQIRRIVREHGFRFVQVADETGMELTNDLHVGTYPTNILIDGSGVVRLVEVGTSPKQKHDLCQMLETVEAEAAEGLALSHSFDMGALWCNPFCNCL